MRIRARLLVLLLPLVAALLVPTAPTSAQAASAGPAEHDRAGRYRYISLVAVSYVRELGVGGVVTVTQRTHLPPGVRLSAHEWQLDLDRDQVADFEVLRRGERARLYELSGGRSSLVRCEGLRTSRRAGGSRTTVAVPVSCMTGRRDRPRAVAVRATSYVTVREGGDVTCDQETFRRDRFLSPVRRPGSRAWYPRRLGPAATAAHRGC